MKEKVNTDFYNINVCKFSFIYIGESGTDIDLIRCIDILDEDGILLIYPNLYKQYCDNEIYKEQLDIILNGNVCYLRKKSQDIFEMYIDKQIRQFCFKEVSDVDVKTLKQHCLNNQYCLGFDTNGRLLFYIRKEDLVDAPGVTTYVHKRKLELYDNMPEQKKGNIPKKIHFIWFKGGRAFNLLNYIAVRAALHHCVGFTVHIHCDAEPSDNFYFNDLKSRGIIIMSFIDVITMNGHPINVFQHRCDIVRLRILKEFGGIYMDLDNILLKSLEPFINHKMVMGYERDDDSKSSLIANGVIMVEPENPMICEWLMIYNTSWGESFIPYWNGHSIHIPYQLSFKYGNIMSIQNNKVFYPFKWDDLSILDKNKDNGQNYENSFSVQLWETESSKTDLLPQTPFYFKTYNNAFTRLFGIFVNDLIIEDDKFITIDGYDMGGCDITCVGRKQPDELKRILLENKDAVAINSLGFLKYAVGLNHLISFNNRSQYCLPQDKLYIVRERCGQKFW